MKKSHLTGLIVAGVAVAVQSDSSSALAGTVTFTNTVAESGASYTIPITPTLVSADELIGISEGSATGGEFSTFTLTADFADSTEDVLFQTNNGANGYSFNLATITDKSFTSENIDGLTFAITSGTGTKSIVVPAGTVFTFDAAPEPSIMALSGLGAAGIWLAARQRAKR